MLVINGLIHMRSGPEVIKKLILNSAEHEILTAHKYQNIKKFSIFRLIQALNAIFLLLNVKLPTIDSSCADSKSATFNSLVKHSYTQIY